VKNLDFQSFLSFPPNLKPPKNWTARRRAEQSAFEAPVKPMKKLHCRNQIEILAGERKMVRQASDTGFQKIEPPQIHSVSADEYRQFGSVPG
jgi:hypothetical protein